MQKWCPEPLTRPENGSNIFVSLASNMLVNEGASSEAVFRPESGFSSSENLLRTLSRDERDQVAKLIEQDLRREFEQRWQAESSARNAQADEQAAMLDTWKASLSLQLEQAIQASLTQLSARISEFAVLLASKVVRREVEVDTGVLARSLEALLYKIEAGRALTITVHPDDAPWLASAPEILERCRIDEVKKDGRIERGGCLVEADELKWDATVSGQLAVLGEVLAAELSVPPSQNGSGGHD